MLSKEYVKSQIAVYGIGIKTRNNKNTFKGIGVYKTTGRGENKTVMCNPYIWVLMAMELNPQLYAKVVTWLTDKLILNRIEAGNMCKALNSALYKIKNTDFSKIAIELNKKAFGKHEAGNTQHAKQRRVRKNYIV